jgi:hypothetical protein
MQIQRTLPIGGVPADPIGLLIQTISAQRLAFRGYLLCLRVGIGSLFHQVCASLLRYLFRCVDA